MHGTATVRGQATHNTSLTEIDWPENEDPEHYTYQGFPDEQGNFFVDLSNKEGSLIEEWLSNIEDETPSDQPSQEQANVLLNSKDFMEALDDPAFRNDLKRACQWIFRRYSQSTLSSWEDLQQEVLLRLARWLPAYRQEANRRTVFTKIARNVLIDIHRSEGTQRRQHEEVTLDELATEPIGERSGKEIENRIFLNECLEGLSEDERNLVDEFFVKGKSLRQLAIVYGVSPAAMSKRWARTMAKLDKR